MNKILVSAALTALLICSAARAAVFVVPTDEELIDQSRLIAVGTVVDATAGLNRHGVIATDVTLRVSTALKGRVKRDEIIHVMQPGGVLPPNALLVSGSAQYRPGEKVLLFADVNDDGEWTTWGLSLGKFNYVSTDQGDVLVREVQQGSLYLSPGGQIQGYEQPRRAAAFTRYVLDLVNGRDGDTRYRGPGVSPLLPSDPAEPVASPRIAATRTIAATASPASAYVMNNFRWQLFDTGGFVTFYVSGRQPGYDDLGAAQRALAAWTNDPGSNVDYRYGGTGGGAFVEDKVNSIVYNASTGVPAGAIAYSQAYAGNQHTYKGETFWTIIEGDVIVKSGLSVSQTVFDEAVTHELGHTLGFRHANEGTPSSSDAVMVSVLTGHWGASLAPWDKEAVDAVYTATSAPPPSSGSGVKGDFNADHIPDILWRNSSTGANAVWLMSGSQTVGGTLDLPALPGSAYRVGGTADFNADGFTDIVWRNQSTGQNAIWLMNGARVTSTRDLPGLVSASFEIEATGDFNGDGRADIVWRNQSTGQNAVWIMSSSQTVQSTIDLPALPNTSYRIGGAGDFNGDGRLDLMWRNGSTGQNAVWLMNGATVSGTLDLPSIPNTAYVVGAIADYNSDGRADIVWRNQSTGQNAIWLMSGASVIATRDLPGLANASYQIVGPK